MPDSGDSCGHWLDLSSDGKLLLAGGTAFRAYPEDLSYAGVATVLDAVKLDRQATRRLAPVVRTR